LRIPKSIARCRGGIEGGELGVQGGTRCAARYRDHPLEGRLMWLTAFHLMMTVPVFGVVIDTTSPHGFAVS
jgi:hypothetical protein